MIIKVDVDEVLRNTLPTFCEINNEITGEHKTVEDITLYDVNTVFPNIKKITGKSAYEVFFIDNCKRIFEDTPAFDGAKEALDYFHTLGHKVLITTIQPRIEAKIATLKWLEKNGIYYDDIIFTNDKRDIKADIIIDDNPTILDNESDDIVKVRIDKPYNLSTFSHFNFDSIKEVMELCENVLTQRKENGYEGIYNK